MPDTSPASGIQVVVTAQTASAWGLRPGSRVAVIAPLQTTISGNGPPSPSFKLNLDVTGIVEPTDPDSSFWKADPLLAAPNLYREPEQRWEGAFIADPGEIATMQEIFGLAGLSIRWEFPVATAGLRGQAPALYSEMKQFTLQTPQLTGHLAPMSNALSTYVCPARAAGDACRGLEWGERPVVDGLCGPGGGGRRDDAPRGPDGRGPPVRGDGRAAGTRSVTGAACSGAGSVGAAVAGVPAAALAWALAVLLVPGPGPTGWVAWWPGIATLAVAVAGPGVAAAWQHRLPRRRRSAGRERARWRRRWADQSGLRGHRLRRGHRRHHRLASDRRARRPVYERGSAARRGPGRDRGAAAVPAAASRAGAGIGSPARRHRLPWPHPRRAGHRHARAPGHNARPHPHHGRVHHHGAGCGGSRRDCGVMAGDWR